MMEFPIAQERRCTRLAWSWISCVFVAVALSSCAQLAGRAAGEAVEQPLEAMTDEKNLENLESIMTSPEVKRSTRELTEAAAAGIVTGVVDGLTGMEMQQRLAALARQSGEAMENRIGPAVASVVETTVDRAMTQMLSEERQQDASLMASRVTRAMTASMMQAMGRELEETVVPAFVRSFENDVAPAVIRGLDDPEFREAVGMIARDLAYQTVLGTNEGIAALADRDPAFDRGALGAWGRRITFGWAGVVAFIMGLGLALVVLAILLVKNASQRRHLEEDSRRREAMLIAVMQSTLMHDTSPEERREMLDRLRAGTATDFEADAKPTATPTESAEGERPRGWRRFAWRHGT